MTVSVALDRTCKDSLLIEAYLDGELDASGVVDIESHLVDCEGCRERLLLDRATRQSLKRVVRSAPQLEAGFREGLRARAMTAMMAEQARQSRPEGNHLGRDARPAAHVDGGSGRFHWRTLVPLASAAALALFWGAASRGALVADAPWRMDGIPGGSGAVRAGIGGDDILADFLHEHSSPVPPQFTDPSDVRALDRYIGVPVRPSRFERNGASLVGASVLPLHQERAAMLQYVIGHGASQRRLSVFIYDPRKIQISGPGLSPRAVGTAQVRVGQENGYSVAVMQNRGVGYAVASDLGPEKSAELAALADDGE